MPTARNARGVDIIAYSQDATRKLAIQVKALSKRNPVPLGTSLEKVMGDFWVIVNKVTSPAPSAFILLPEEVKKLAHCGEKKGRVSFWLQPKSYDQESFKEKWEERIGHGWSPEAQPIVPGDRRKAALAGSLRAAPSAGP